MPCYFRKFENMKKLFAVGLLSIVLLSSMSCKEDPVTPEPTEPENSVRIDVQPVFNGNDLFLDSVYATVEGYKVKFTDLGFYFEDVRNGSVQLTDAMLFDYDKRGTLLYDGPGKASDFDNLEANLGVGPANNNSDPTNFPNDSWLNITNSDGFYWLWNQGFIFVRIEGIVDTIPDANDVFDQSIVLHAGNTGNHEAMSFSNLNWTSIGTNRHQLNMELDMSEFLQSALHTIDLQAENSLHSAVGQEALITKVMENFKEALTP